MIDHATEVILTLDEFEALTANVIRVRHDLPHYAKALLTPLERECIVSLARGDHYDEVIARTGYTWKAIDNAVQRARKKLQPLRDAA